MAVMGKQLMQHTAGPPLDVAQFALLCALRFVDPLTFTQIFPYINQLLSALHLVDDPAKVGFYSGLVVRLFFCLPPLFVSDPDHLLGVHLCLLPALQHLPVGAFV
jgi:hypothetical protein